MNERQEPLTRGLHNPNGLFEAILDPSFAEQVPDRDQRLTYVTADVQMYLQDVLGVDKDMANIVAARALQEFLAAVEVTLPKETVSTILNDADAYLNSPDLQ